MKEAKKNVHVVSSAPGFSKPQVNSAQVQDSGRYSCQATNVAGKTEKNYNLNVWGELVLNQIY